MKVAGVFRKYSDAPNRSKPSVAAANQNYILEMYEWLIELAVE